MKIIGGSFGAHGQLNINSNGSLKIEAAHQASYNRMDIESIDASTPPAKQGKGAGFVVASILVVLILMFFSVIGGLIAAVALFAIGASGGDPMATATVSFKDGKAVKVEATKESINTLYRSMPSTS